MTRKSLFSSIFCTLLFCTISSASSTANNRSRCWRQKREVEIRLETVVADFKDLKHQTVLDVKDIFEGQQPCSTLREQNLRARLERTEKIQKQLIPVLTASSDQKKPARVPRPMVLPKLGSSLNFSCEPPTPQNLGLCLWERTLPSGVQLIILDKPYRHGDQTSIEGISYFGNDGLKDGKCGLRIDSVTKTDLNRPWMCTLVSKTDRNIYTGQVRIEKVPTIYFATYEGRIKAQLLNEPGKISTIVDNRDSARGIAYDPTGDRIYWSTINGYKILRATVDGKEVQTVFHDNKYKSIQCLASDWITGNLYVGTQAGNILVCNTTGATNISCYQVPKMTGQGNIQGITVDPIKGQIYWTRYASWSGSSIARAGMDGSDRREIVSGLTEPAGIVLDFSDSSKLYWADWGTEKIQSWDGKQVIDVVTGAGQPFGLAIVNDTIVWSGKGNKQLRSRVKKSGGVGDVDILCTDNNYLRHIAVVPGFELPTRVNHCEEQSCSTLCVLTANSVRCLD